MNLFKSASTSGPARPRTGKSIRGKISGPIPIPNPADDDEFPIRNPGTNIASNSGAEEFPIRPRGPASPSPASPPPQDYQSPYEPPPPPAPPGPAEPHTTSRSGSGASRHDEVNHYVIPATPEPPTSPPPAPIFVPSPATELAPAPAAIPLPLSPAPIPPATPQPGQDRTSNPPGTSSGSSPVNNINRRTNAPSTVRYSVISNTSVNTGTSENRPQRKKSTLRGALSRLFGRKKKKGSSQASTAGDTDRTSSVVPSSNHRSDTSGLSRVKEAESKRSASFPITEYDRALRSHSIGPSDLTTLENVRNSIHMENTTPNRRRAMTATNSRLFGSPAKRNEFGEWSGLSPRPVSSHARGIRTDDDPSMIGRAITSDIPSDYTTKRRSRSLSGMDLQHLGGHDNTGSGVRRRSDEIRYWRDSYGGSLLSPLSSTQDGGNGDDQDDTGVLSSTDPSDPSHVSRDHPPAKNPPTTPPQPFNFGNLANMTQLAGMRITQAASLETRMGNVEVRTQRLERVVDQLCHSVPGFNGPMADSTDQIPRSVPADFDMYGSSAGHLRPDAGVRNPSSSSRYSSSRHSVDTDGHTSHMSFGEGQTFIGSLHPPSSATTQQPLSPAIPSPYQGGPGFRPNSTSTVRGATSMPALSVVAASEAAAADLSAQLEAERADRMALELQVKKLSERVNTLSATMYAMLRDPQKMKSYERLSPLSAVGGDAKSSTASSQQATPTKAPQASSSGLGIERGKRPPPPIVLEPPALSNFQSSGKTLSVFEDDGDESDRGEESLSDSFQTPREEYPPHTFGAFGEELREDMDDPNRKKAARTLSLSQLTANMDTRAVV